MIEENTSDIMDEMSLRRSAKNTRKASYSLSTADEWAKGVRDTIREAKDYAESHQKEWDSNRDESIKLKEEMDTINIESFNSAYANILGTFDAGIEAIRKAEDKLAKEDPKLSVKIGSLAFLYELNRDIYTALPTINSNIEKNIPEVKVNKSYALLAQYYMNNRGYNKLGNKMESSDIVNLIRQNPDKFKDLPDDFSSKEFIVSMNNFADENARIFSIMKEVNSNITKLPNINFAKLKAFQKHIADESNEFVGDQKLYDTMNDIGEVLVKYYGMERKKAEYDDKNLEIQRTYKKYVDKIRGEVYDDVDNEGNPIKRSFNFTHDIKNLYDEGKRRYAMGQSERPLTYNEARQKALKAQFSRIQQMKDERNKRISDWEKKNGYTQKDYNTKEGLAGFFKSIWMDVKRELYGSGVFPSREDFAMTGYETMHSIKSTIGFAKMKSLDRKYNMYIRANANAIDDSVRDFGELEVSEDIEDQKDCVKSDENVSEDRFKKLPKEDEVSDGQCYFETPCVGETENIRYNDLEANKVEEEQDLER